MKTFLPVLLISAVITSCTNQPDIGAPQAALPAADTSGFAEFQQWKNFKAHETQTNTVYVVKRVPASVPAPVSERYESKNAGAPVSSPDIPGAEQPEPEKKGWSKAAKGAAIGGASGAVLGAVINKRNRVVGGAVGGAVGAGVGYGIGRHMDKKDGRY